VAQTLRQSFDGFRVRLDDGARRAAQKSGRPRIRPLRATPSFGPGADGNQRNRRFVTHGFYSRTRSLNETGTNAETAQDQAVGEEEALDEVLKERVRRVIA